MADKDRISSILTKLRREVTLSLEEVTDLQSHIDQLENLGRSAASHHDTHSTPGSHYSQHHSTVVDIAGILDTIARRQIQGSAK